MNVILTSSGLSTPKLKKVFLSMLKKKVNKVKVIVLHTADDPGFLYYVDWVGKELSKIGILHPNIIYLNISTLKKSPRLNEYDAIYVCGGNTYFILDKIRKSGLDKSLRNFVKANKVYVGASAGSIIAGKNIESAGWGSEADTNDIHLKNLKGINITNIVVFPHYKLKLKEEFERFRKKVNYPLESVKDGEAIVIKGKQIRKI